jgi:c-di-GMP-binding flagellar brake protein YcgR
MTAWEGRYRGPATDICIDRRFFSIYYLPEEPEEIVMGLEEKDRRAEERNPCKLEVEYSVQCRNSEEPDPGPRRTYTADISHGGMGLYSECPVREGQKIEIFLFNILKDPLTGEVRWCRKHSDDLFIIGVQFC